MWETLEQSQGWGNHLSIGFGHVWSTLKILSCWIFHCMKGLEPWGGDCPADCTPESQAGLVWRLVLWMRRLLYPLPVLLPLISWDNSVFRKAPLSLTFLMWQLLFKLHLFWVNILSNYSPFPFSSCIRRGVGCLGCLHCLMLGTIGWHLLIGARPCYFGYWGAGVHCSCPYHFVTCGPEGFSAWV